MDSKKLNEDFWKELEKVVENSFVPRISTDTVRPCKEEDFHEYRKILMENLHSIESMIDIVQNKDQWTEEAKGNLLKILMVVGEQHCKSSWNTDEVVTLAQILCFKICKIFDFENVTQIFKDENLFVSAIMFLRGKLMKDTWKSFPAAVLCYKWLLESIDKPLLKRHVPEVLPTALIIFDDYQQENQELGLECINLIIQHCQQSRALRNMNYDQVIFEALERTAYKVEPNMIINLYSCISNLLDCMEYCEDISNIYRWTKRDTIFMILLDNMELQGNLQARYAYMISLKKFANHSSCGKWSERISRIVGEYCEENIDKKITDVSLDFLEYFLTMYQPKSQNFYIVIYSSLLKLKYNLNGSIEKDLCIKVEHCISLLNELCPSISKEIALKNNKLGLSGIAV